MEAGELMAPAKSVADMQHIIFNDYVNAALTAGFLFVVVVILFYSIGACRKALRNSQPTAVEIPPSGETAHP